VTGSSTLPRALVVGDVIDDIVVRPLGETAIDTDTTSTIIRSPGGSAANQAAWLASLGVRTRFVARVGKADVERHAADLSSYGVEALLGGDDELPTGTIVVLLGPDGERTMFTDRGANLRLCRADLPVDVLDDVDLLHVNGYTMFERGSRDAMLQLIEEARRRGIPFTVDPCSSAYLADAGPFLEWTAGASVCFPNLDEAAALTGCNDVGMSLDALSAVYPVVVLKRGRGGVTVGRRGESPVQLATSALDIRDTTGAGDALCAGFIASWLGGAEPLDAAIAGQRAAAVAVSVSGGRPPVKRNDG
jgi:sugar/nucleoside kinase (ribokinase family)